MSTIETQDPRATMGRMTAMRYGNVPKRAILTAETVGTATLDGESIPFEVQVWRVPASCADGGTHFLRVYTGAGDGFARSWSYTGRRVARCWTEYAALVEGIARDADAVEITRQVEATPMTGVPTFRDIDRLEIAGDVFGLRRAADEVAASIARYIARGPGLVGIGDLAAPQWTGAQRSYVQSLRRRRAYALAAAERAQGRAA